MRSTLTRMILTHVPSVAVMPLPELTVVADEYAVGRALSARSFAVRPYQAWELESQAPTVLLEYFPDQLARRADDDVEVVPHDDRTELYQFGLERFVAEHETLVQIDHPSIIREIDLLRAHGTAYRVQQREMGSSLTDVLERKGRLPEDVALAVLTPILKGLGAVHEAGLLHEGLAPQAVHLAKTGQPILWHFRHAESDLARRMDAIDDAAIPGYTSPEQLASDVENGTWSDIYAAGSLLYRMLAGHALPDARERLKHDEVPILIDALEVAPALQDALHAALVLDPVHRVQTVPEWLERLHRSQSVQPRADDSEASTPDAEEPTAAGIAGQNRNGLSDESLPADPEGREAFANDEVDDRAEPAPAPRDGSDESVETTSGELDSYDEAEAPEPGLDPDSVADADRDDAVPAEVEVDQIQPEPAPDLVRSESATVEDADEAEETWEVGVSGGQVDPRAWFEADDDEAAGDGDAESISAAGAEDELHSEAAPDEFVQPDSEPDSVAEAPDADGLDAPEAESDMDEPEHWRDTVEESAGVENPSVDQADGSDVDESSVPFALVPGTENDERPVTDYASDRPARKRRIISRRTIVLGIVGALVFFGGITAGSAIFVRGERSGPSDGASATAVVEQADVLLEAGEYQAARRLYERALALDEDDPSLQQRIDDVDARIERSEQSVFDERMARGERLLLHGDSLRGSGDEAQARNLFAAANIAFIRALDVRPDDSLALAYMQQTTVRLAGQEDAAQADGGEAAAGNGADEPGSDVEDVRGEMVALLMQQGEERLVEGDTAAAQRKFSEALELRPDAALAERLQELEDARELGERRARYAAAMQRGRDLREEGSFAAARAAFEDALRFQPDDAEATAQIRSIDQQRQAERERQRQYQYYRAQGDIRLGEGDLAAALESYQEAAAHAPPQSDIRVTISEVERRLRLEEEARAERTDENGVYLYADEPPQLVGSLKDLYAKTTYPRVAQRVGIEGRVFVQSVVDEEGRVVEAKVLRGIGGGCDEEALRVIKEARFIPGRVDGEPVKVRHTMFIHFQLETGEAFDEE